MLNNEKQSEVIQLEYYAAIIQLVIYKQYTVNHIRDFNP